MERSLLVLAAATGVVACRQTAAPPTEATLPPARVEVVLAHRERVAPTVELTGEVQPVSSVKLFTEAEGAITELRADEGDRVTAGQLLAVIDERVPRAQVAQAEAAAALARATHFQLAVQLDYADKERERVAKLHEGKVVDDRTWESARSTADALRAQLGVAAAQIRQADAALVAARVHLASCRLVAPLAGVVTRRSVRLHQYVEKAREAFALVDTRAMELVTNVPAELARGLHPGDPLEFHAGGDAAPYRGEVVAVIPELDPVSRTLRVKARIANPDGRLVAGMFAVAYVPTGAPRESLVVPANAVRGESGSAYVWVVRDGAAARVDVTAGSRAGASVEVQGALGEGERVITAGADALEPGRRVDVAAAAGPERGS
jgi:membrane fusion protein (multidrug efflux system)